MIKKIKKFAVTAMVSLSLFAPGLVPALASTAFADTGGTNVTGGLCAGINSGANNNLNTDCGTAGTGNGQSDISNLASRITNLFSLIVGIAAVVMVVYSGFRYITSGGDSNRVGSAKNSLIYAIVGLVIVAMAQFIVHYVINQTQGVQGGTT